MQTNSPKINKALIVRVLECMPEPVALKITEFLHKNGISQSSVNEIRLRGGSTSGAVVSGKNISIGVIADKSDVRECLKRICDGAVYAHRDEISKGYVTLSGGVRVGVCGTAGYEDSRLVGVGDVTSLIFRVPNSECSFSGEIWREWRRRSGGMLIISAAGDGKTTAIRALAKIIGTGKERRHVVVVDERCEFDVSEYKDADVDILRGYRRELGIEIAIRTMSAEVLIVDEIGSVGDASALNSAIGAGVEVIATAHGQSMAQVMKRGYIRELISAGLFASIVVIRRCGESFGIGIEYPGKT